jgi:hypothetical protein
MSRTILQLAVVLAALAPATSSAFVSPPPLPLAADASDQETRVRGINLGAEIGVGASSLRSPGSHLGISLSAWEVASDRTYAANNPLRYTDPTGRDIWIEGPSGWEPPGHESINIGDPLGSYDSFSFAINGFGRVYQDESLGGEILQYLKTSPEQDLQAKLLLLQQSDKDNKRFWTPAHTCEDYSREKFNQFNQMFGPPPPDPLLPSIGPGAPMRSPAPWYGFIPGVGYIVSTINRLF